MLKVLQNEGNLQASNDHWLQVFGASFRDRFTNNLAGPFRNMSAKLALAMLHNKSVTTANRGYFHFHSTISLFFIIIYVFIFTDLTRSEMQLDMEKLQRLEHYSRNLADYHLITDIVPTVSQLYCNSKMGDTHLTAVQTVRILKYFS